MKGALVGIATAWIIIGVFAGIIWMFDNHPEIASWLAFAVLVTLVGAIVGLAYTS